ncbi:alpha/beta hydrolase [Nocardia sp. NEAU-351]|uniref:Alpha/beta hydrolase n=1 Tax=Nocardia bovistercoris TaxID=2785916 RepID=A0A931IHC2_9NOCA|nr:alpha/beta hydrolase [Nocardia bovistercoris]MBH0781797.1 alpha/beta hydrolase [Nocardia bovistercoris]
MRFTAESSSYGLVERDFIVGGVPGVLWSPTRGVDRAPLVLMCHAGGNHKKHPAMAGRAQRFVTDGGFHVAVIDAPGHGDRPRTAHDERELAALQAAKAAGEPEGPSARRYSAYLAELAVPEWRATLDALQELPEIGVDGPVGYFGINLGTAVGVSLLVVEPRITAAVLGLHWPDTLAEKAKRITIPIQFDLQWDDEDISREAGLALFDAFASEEKTLHANAGTHHELPRFETDSATGFFIRHLSRANHTPAETNRR